MYVIDLAFYGSFDRTSIETENCQRRSLGPTVYRHGLADMGPVESGNARYQNQNLLLWDMLTPSAASSIMRSYTHSHRNGK
jgi:hypothetical protein